MLRYYNSKNRSRMQVVTDGFYRGFAAFLWAECKKQREKLSQAKKSWKKTGKRIDKTNRLWYSVLATGLDKANHVAPEKAEASARSLSAGSGHTGQNSIPPFLSPFDVGCSKVCSASKSAAQGAFGTASCAAESKNGTCSLTTCRSRFLLLC